MKKYLSLFIPLLISLYSYSQTTVVAPGEYKNVIIPFNPADYSRNVILLHEMYDGAPISANYAIGTISALRGGVAAWSRLNVAEISSASSYTEASANVSSIYNNGVPWKLKTCIYEGKKYLVLDVPYQPSFHDHGYKFIGWVRSTGLSMVAITYELNGAPVNQNLISNIQDFKANQSETHDVSAFNVLGNVGIGTVNPKEKLSVNGNIRAREIKVETTEWPDYVFEEGYKNRSLADLSDFISKHKHLPEMPSAKEAEQNGIELGEMNKLLLRKIEELTLHLIDLKKENTDMKARLSALEENR